MQATDKPIFLSLTSGRLPGKASSLRQRRCPTHGSCTPRGSRAPKFHEARACEASSDYYYLKRYHFVPCTGHTSYVAPK